ncbi:nucleotidyltransferase-like protein [Desertibacillus haloalkaliphilus]|uniref:nucleotidyltransferase-like protein n=1 Tax=Desertibacillus haloalkaliphilus TaxID=1328930 RepID=UPI001C25DC7D|nr:nucleotidyltransferase-like protein [Desertibacillus haloalkaliphilus]MBU8908849.1 hypothetical protein [Desertibacillus haloalkaliphilus]
MEDLLRQLYQDKASEPETLGIFIVEKEKVSESITDLFDVVLLIVRSKKSESWFVKHYEFRSMKVAVHYVNEELLYNWLITGNNRRVIDWVFHGKILFDRNEFVSTLRERINDFPLEDRKKKIGIEFAKLIRRFEDGKELYKAEHYFDAFNNIMHALHHLARLAVIEHGFFPEVTVWKQVKSIEPQIYKLYEELIVGEEPIDKRLELLLIANEFAVSSKTSLGATHLLEVMGQKEEVWSFSELMNQTEVVDYALDLELLLNHLAKKDLVEVIRIETKGKGIFHRFYKKYK